MDKMHVIVVTNSRVKDLANLIDEPVENTMERLKSVGIIVTDPQERLKDEDIHKLFTAFDCTVDIIDPDHTEEDDVIDKALKDNVARQKAGRVKTTDEIIEKYLQDNPGAKVYRS